MNKFKSEFFLFQKEVQINVNLELQLPNLPICFIPRDDPSYYHALIFPKLHHQLKRTNSAPIQIITFFKKNELKISSDTQLPFLETKNQIIYPSPTINRLNDQFDRVLKAVLYHQKKVIRAFHLRERLKGKFLESYQKKLFLGSLFNLHDDNIETDNIIENLYSNYCWHIESKNRPRGERKQIVLKNIN